MRRFLSLWWTIFLIFCMMGGTIAAETSRTFWQNEEYAPGEIIVKFKSGFSIPSQKTRDKIAGVILIQELGLIGAQHIRLPEGTSVQDAVHDYNADPQVEYAEPNYKVYPLLTPNDTFFGELWGLRNIGQTVNWDLGTSDADIDAPEAWDIQTGSSSVIIAVIDTGVYYTHPDLSANIWTNSGEIAGNGLDDDSNGYIDDIRGWDFWNGDNSVYDDSDGDYHGTHVAGTIAAVGNNSTGVVGVCWTAKIMPLKFIGPFFGFTSDAILAIEYAIDKGANIMSNSWGGGAFSQALKDAIDAAGTAGILFVAAAGNDGSDNDADPAYPASYTSDNIIAVAATDNDDRLASFSNYGETSVDVGAPGVEIYSTFPPDLGLGSYYYLDGTSMATPHVSGLAGLLKAQFTSLDDAGLKGRILATVDAISSLSDKSVTGGRINAFSALVAGAQPYIIVNSTTVDDAGGNNNGYVDPGESFTLTITLKNLWETATGISAVLSTTDTYITITSNSSSYPNLNAGGSGNSITPYSLRASASTPNLHRADFSLSITANSGAYTVTRTFSLIILGGTSGMLLVDDDEGNSYDDVFESALTANGYTYLVWDTQALGSPPVIKMSPEPMAVVWTTGAATTGTLTSTDQTNLADYLDGKGSLFLSSEGALSELGWGVDTFTTEYLKVASGSSNIVLGTASVQGVNNDPITNGLNLTLTRTKTGDDYYYSVPTPDIQDLADEVRPDLTVATQIFTNPANSNLPSALRYPASGSAAYKVVFLAFPFEAVDNSSGVRNTLMQKIIEWLRPDTTSPAQVTNLSAATGSSEGEVTLTWTAPGDDGTSGTATSYVIRRNTVSITSSNWATSSDVSGEPTPSAAGTTETVTLSGLPGGQNYYFALKAMDEEGNASLVSNSIQATVQKDMTAPSSVSDLTAALGSNPGEVILSWTAPGDDGNVGKATSYDVRYLAGSAISGSNWATATAVTSGEPTPAIAGSSESMTVSGLVDNTTYYFALKSKDDLNNTSNISNSPSILMPDTTPPSGNAISDFTATAGDGQVTLSWTWNTGTGATGLVIVVGTDTSPMALSEGIQLDRVLSPNTSYTHSGLTNGKTYYYSAFAFDDSENFSSAVTSSGVTPGAGGGGGGGGCFIATAAYGTPMCDEVVSLCSFRDRYLMTNLPGRMFVKTYYKVSPPIAGFISEREYLKKFMRAALKPVISFVKSSQ